MRKQSWGRVGPIEEKEKDKEEEGWVMGAEKKEESTQEGCRSSGDTALEGKKQLARLKLTSKHFVAKS